MALVSATGAPRIASPLACDELGVPRAANTVQGQPATAIGVDTPAVAPAKVGGAHAGLALE
jgi:hypothetical protein